MSNTSAQLAMPFLAPAQAQKHVTHNEALQILDAVVQLSVVSRMQTTPPTAADLGARFIVPLLADADWADRTDQLAVWTGTGWIYLTPQTGWRAWVDDEKTDVIWHGDDWQLAAGLGALDTLGVNTSADPTNRLAVSADATLLNHSGAGHQLKVNKAAPTDTASLLFQSDWSGKAEMGLAGNDAWSIKVSPDGAAWTDALVLDPATGHASGAAVQSNPADGTLGRVLTVGAFGLGTSAMAVAAAGLDTIDAVGFYRLTDALPGVLMSGANVLHSQSNDSEAVQIAFQPDADVIKWRRKSGGIWLSWQNIFANTTVLGAVSQQSGVPTGAVIERGSSADGHFARFADGTQMCTADLTLTQAASDSVQQNWTFPVPFATGTKPSLSGVIDIDGLIATPSVNDITGPFTAAHSETSTMISYRRITGAAAFGAGDTAQVHATAIGRWF